MRVGIVFAIVGMQALVAGIASACSVSAPFPFPGLFERPTEIATDGSFSGVNLNRGHGREFDVLEGARIIDIGGGRVGQKLIEPKPCGIMVERLLFVDCTSAMVIIIDGAPDPDQTIAGAQATRIDLIQRPIGPIGLRASTTIAEVAAIAQAQGYEVTTDVLAEMEGVSRANRYDPYLGCKLFYPESAGAQS